MKWYITYSPNVIHLTTNREEALYQESLIEIEATKINMGYLFRMLNRKFTALDTHTICNCSGELTK